MLAVTTPDSFPAEIGQHFLFNLKKRDSDFRDVFRPQDRDWEEVGDPTLLSWWSKYPGGGGGAIHTTLPPAEHGPTLQIGKQAQRTEAPLLRVT